MASGIGIDFCSLGMFIIDEIEFDPESTLFNTVASEAKGNNGGATRQRSYESFIDEKSGSRVLTNIMGGAGSYAALGARIVAGAERARTVGWIADCGSDFPSTMRTKIEEWGTNCYFRQTPNRLTTRGWCGYGKGEQRAFKYMTPKLRLDETSLTLDLLASASFHLICSPSRCLTLANGILRRRRDAGVMAKPLFIWEPVPDLCTEAELPACQAALAVVDVVSPNHVELAGFFGKTEDDVKNTGNGSNRTVIEEMITALARTGKTDRVSGVHVVVRAGIGGCCVYDGTTRSVSWLPSYYSATQSKSVVDPTGAGNTFLGGLAVALARGSSIITAAALASIAAAVAIEQIGMPDLENDRWNGRSLTDRKRVYQTLMSNSGIDASLESAS